MFPVRIALAVAVVAIGAATAFHGIQAGIIRRRIRNRFRRDMPDATGRAAVALGVATIVAGAVFMFAGALGIFLSWDY